MSWLMGKIRTDHLVYCLYTTKINPLQNKSHWTPISFVYFWEAEEYSSHHVNIQHHQTRLQQISNNSRHLVAFESNKLSTTHHSHTNTSRLGVPKTSFCFWCSVYVYAMFLKGRLSLWGDHFFFVIGGWSFGFMNAMQFLQFFFITDRY